MAALESYSVKPTDLPPMTVRALDGNHLSLILSDLFTRGFWKNLDDRAHVEIRSPHGETVSPLIKEFRTH